MTTAGDAVEEYVEAVLALVERIPPGRVMSYGAIADALAPAHGGRGSPRRVGTIMARYGGGVPWHRVVTAAGRLPPGSEQRARERLVAEGTPLQGDRVRMARAAWYPPESLTDLRPGPATGPRPGHPRPAPGAQRVG